MKLFISVMISIILLLHRVMIIKMKVMEVV